MALRFEQVVVDSENPKALAEWWREALGWQLTYQGGEGEGAEYEIAPDGDTHPSLLFLTVPERKTVKNRLHLDFVPTADGEAGEADGAEGADAPDPQQLEVARLEALGATRVDIGQKDVGWVVLADPEGNEFCVLRAR
ncbi:VOC family protein [Herbiconiux sp. CPCC 205716]|uniref:VOC family protein n=1 Tax=Herbiconiux gentiana TaxID=2970912 RepID=A0ABT2GKP9_9MICO|nr:VOC family protein [Herbiconiux gentiana]MCS5715336.1 VOC family protein [Herbiconiux gentiana]